MQANLSVHNPAASSGQGVLPSFSSGLNRLVSSPWLTVGLWLLSLGTALFATLPVRAMLRDVLALRPIGERIARGEYDVGFIEVMSDNPAAMAAVSSALMTAGLVYLLLQAVIAGGVLSRLSPDESPRHIGPGRLLLRAAETAGPMLKLELLFALLVRTPLLLVGGAVAGFAIGWQKAGSLAWVSLAGRLLPVVLVFMLLWSLASTWLNFARLRRLDDEATSVWQALRGGLRSLSVPSVLLGALLLSLLSVGGHGGLFVLGRMLTFKLDAQLLVLAAFAVRQGFSLLRTALSVWVLATTCALDPHSTSR